jgi:adenine-specific DNA-methyltransferase
MVDTHLLKNKKVLIERQIKKFNENNWWEWGAPRNIKKMEIYHGVECIYIRSCTRNKIVAFIGKVDYFAGLLMLRPTKKCNLQKVIDYLNDEEFKFNYMYSGRFKIGQRQLCNSYILYIQ